MLRVEAAGSRGRTCVDACRKAPARLSRRSRSRARAWSRSRSGAPVWWGSIVFGALCLGGPAAHALDLTYVEELRAASRSELGREITVDEPAVRAAEAARGASYFGGVARDQLRPWAVRGISRADLEETRRIAPRAVRYQIIDGKIYRQRSCYIEARCRGIEHFLRAVAADVPDVDLVVNVQDPAFTSVDHPLPLFSFSRVPARNADILYPAWAFWEGGPAVSVIPTWRWDTMRAELLAAGAATSWKDKVPRVFFRGSRTSASRDPYVELGERDPAHWDVRYTLNQSASETLHVTEVMGLTPAAPVAPADHCRFKYLLNFDGVAASFRLKNVLACGSLVLYVSPTWEEFFYPRLVPWVHYVPVGEDPAEAQQIVGFLVRHDAIAAAIAANGREFIERRLTFEAVETYWRTLLVAYGARLTFAPTPDPALVPLDEL